MSVSILFARRTCWSLFALFLLLLGAPQPADAALSAFQFATAATSWSSISGTGSRLMSPTVDDGAAASTSIGFTFNLDGTNYTNFSASSNGLLGLTTGTVTTAYSNSMPTSYGYPIITPLWDDLYLSATSHGIWYQVTGSAPNRVLTVEWNVRHISSTGSNYEFQVKLYEGSNQVDFVYGPSTPYTSQSASVGMSINTGNFASVTFGSPSSVSYSSANNNNNTFPSSGVVLRWTLCQGNIALAGSTAEGGTAGMASGDTLLSTKSLTMGSTTTYRPFTATVGATPCAPLTYQFSITGPAAADYQISPTSGPLSANSSVTPVITFTPRADGPRHATLTVTDNYGLNRTYPLKATGVRRIAFDGNIAQGGTAAMASGDTLLQGLGTARLGTITFTPLTLRNFSTDLAATPATATYAINDPTGQYTIAPPTATIGSGQTNTPVITFRPTGVGPQYAQMTVSVDNETRVYVLAAISAAPQMTVTSGGLDLGGTVVLHRETACAGEQVLTMPIEIRNVGLVPTTIRNAAVYLVDSLSTIDLAVRPLQRDAFGRLVVDPTYQIASSPGGAPLNRAIDQSWPLTLLPGQSRTLYLNFVGPMPGNRPSRVFLWTDGENFAFADTNGAVQTGVLSFLARPNVIGGTLAGTIDNKPLKPVVFGEVKIGDTAYSSIVVANAGLCDLRISRADLRFITGDVNEFRVVRAFAGARIDPITDDYIVPAQSTDTIVVSFIPGGRGGRRATLLMKTNDSTLYLQGLSERGVQRLDVFGTGTTDLVGRDLYLGSVVVGRTVSGVVEFSNPNLIAIDVDAIEIIGPDAADFTMDPARPWPALPVQVGSNGSIQLGVLFTAQGLQGRREATIVLSASGRRLGAARLTAVAGNVEIVVSPLSLFDDVTVSAGQTVRRTVVISNVGTFDLILQPPTIDGADAANYRVGVLPRLVVPPGGTEYLEVTFSPENTGQSSASLTIASNAGTPVVVSLGGTAQGVRSPDEEDPSRSLDRDDRDARSTPSSAALELALGRVEASVGPNPAFDRLGVTVASGRSLRLTLSIVDVTGRIVQRMNDVDLAAGTSAFDVNISDVPAGTYGLRLDGPGIARTVRFVVAR
ncbi:MAG TPA: choice-of-anchor D domain-containing protein [Candidatus Kapabacteria bacterium]|nr:choice-of-anchor D domain-containing protein [Candidatus Kapabacteria bacterium]